MADSLLASWEQAVRQAEEGQERKRQSTLAGLAAPTATPSFAVPPPLSMMPPNLQAPSTQAMGSLAAEPVYTAPPLEYASGPGAPTAPLYERPEYGGIQMSPMAIPGDTGAIAADGYPLIEKAIPGGPSRNPPLHPVQWVSNQIGGQKKLDQKQAELLISYIGDAQGKYEWGPEQAKAAENEIIRLYRAGLKPVQVKKTTTDSTGRVVKNEESWSGLPANLNLPSTNPLYGFKSTWTPPPPPGKGGKGIIEQHKTHIVDKNGNVLSDKGITLISGGVERHYPPNATSANPNYVPHPDYIVVKGRKIDYGTPEYRREEAKWNAANPAPVVQQAQPTIGAIPGWVQTPQERAREIDPNRGRISPPVGDKDQWGNPLLPVTPTTYEQTRVPGYKPGMEPKLLPESQIPKGSMEGTTYRAPWSALAMSYPGTEQEQVTQMTNKLLAQVLGKASDWNPASATSEEYHAGNTADVKIAQLAGLLNLTKVQQKAVSNVIDEFMGIKSDTGYLPGTYRDASGDIIAQPQGNWWEEYSRKVSQDTLPAVAEGFHAGIPYLKQAEKFIFNYEPDGPDRSDPAIRELTGQAVSLAFLISVGKGTTPMLQAWGVKPQYVKPLHNLVTMAYLQPQDAKDPVDAIVRVLKSAPVAWFGGKLGAMGEGAASKLTGAVGRVARGGVGFGEAGILFPAALATGRVSSLQEYAKVYPEEFKKMFWWGLYGAGMGALAKPGARVELPGFGEGEITNQTGNTFTVKATDGSGRTRFNVRERQMTVLQGVEERAALAESERVAASRPPAGENAVRVTEAAKPEEAVTAKEPWQMSYWELRDALTLADKAGLENSRPLLRALYPDKLADATDPWGIKRAVEKGDEFPRVPTVDLSKRHRQIIEQALRDGKPVPPEVLAEYPDLAPPPASPAAPAEAAKEPMAVAPPVVEARSAEAPAGKEPWDMNREEFENEFWYHGRGETHPHYGRDTTIGGIAKSMDAAKGFARIRTDRKPGVGEISLIRETDIPKDFREEIGNKDYYSPKRSITWKVSYNIPGDTVNAHKYLVEQALRDGKTPYKGWEQDYPELAAQYQPAEAPAGEGAAPGGGKPIFSPDEIDIKRATNAYQWNSMYPERAGKIHQTDYVNHMTSLYEKMSPLAKTPEQRAMLMEEIERYRKDYIRHLYEWLDARSRTASPMVTGPSNFPTARNQKALNAEGKRLNAFNDWQDKAQESIRAKLEGPKIISSDVADAPEQLRQKIAKAEQAQEMYKGVNAILRKKGLTDDQKVAQIVEKYGVKEENAREWLKPDFAGRVGIPSFVLTNNKSNIARMQERLASIESKRQDMSQEFPFENGKVVDSVEDNRIQIFYDAKPSTDTIARLRESGFRWAPSVGAWQRQRTNSTISAVKRIVGIDMEKPTPVAPPAATGKAAPAPAKPEAIQPTKAETRDIMTMTREEYAGEPPVIPDAPRPLNKLWGSNWRLRPDATELQKDFSRKSSARSKALKQYREYVERSNEWIRAHDQTQQIADRMNEYGKPAAAAPKGTPKTAKPKPGSVADVGEMTPKPPMTERLTEEGAAALERLRNRKLRGAVNPAKGEGAVDQLAQDLKDLYLVGRDVFNNVTKDFVEWSKDVLKRTEGWGEEHLRDIYAKVTAQADREGGWEKPPKGMGTRKTGKSIAAAPMTPEVVGEVDIKGKQGEWLYEKRTNQGQLDAARETIGDETQTGEAALRRRLRDDHQWTGDDTALGIEVIRRAFAAGDDVLGVELSKALAKKLTVAGQAVQAASIIKRMSAEGQLLRAQRSSAKAREELGKGSQAREDTLTSAIDNVMKAETAKVAKELGREIDAVTELDFAPDMTGTLSPAERLFHLIDNYLAKPKEARDVDPEQAMIQQMVTELFAIAKQTLPKRAWVGKSPYAVVGEIVKNRAAYPEVWDAAKVKVLDAYAGDAAVKARLDAYTAQNPVPVVSDKRLNTIIRTAFKDKGVKLGTLVREYYQGGREQLLSLKDYLVEQTGLTDADADYLSKFVVKRMAEQGREAQLKALEGLLKGRGISVKPTLLDSVKQFNILASLRAFRTPAFADAVMAKLPDMLRTAMRRAKVNMDRVVRAGVVATETERARFTEQLANQLNVPIAEAKKIIRAAYEEFTKVADERREGILKNMTPKERLNVTRQNAIDKLITLYHLGGFGEARLRDYVRQILNTPTLTEEGGAMINRVMMAKEDLVAAGGDEAKTRTAVENILNDDLFFPGQQDFVRGMLDLATTPEAREAFATRLNAVLMAKMDQYIGKLRYPFTRWDKLEAYTYANVLSGIGTHERNALGNILNSNMILSTRAVESMLKDMSFSSPEAKAYWKGFYNMKSQGKALQAFLWGLHGLEGYRGESLDFRPRYEFRGELKNPFNWPSRLLMAADDYTKSLARESYYEARASDVAAKEGLNGTALDERVQSLIDNKAFRQEHFDGAEAEAGKHTFTEKGDKIQQTLQLVANASLPRRYWGVGGMKPLKPMVLFVQVPYQIAKSGMKHGPLGFLRYVDPEMRTPENRGLVAAQASFGSLLIIPLAFYAYAGGMTLQLSSQEEQETGKKRYSVKIGDRWIPYSWLGPLMPSFVTAAGIGQLKAENRTITDDEWEKVLGRTVGQMIRANMEQNALSGTNAFMQALQDPNRYGKSVVGNQVGMVIPGSAALRTGVAAADPYQRDPQTMLDYTMGWIPGLSRLTPARTDKLGNPLPRENAGWGSVLPFRVKQDRRNLTLKEINRLKMHLGGVGTQLKVGDTEVNLNYQQEQMYKDFYRVAFIGEVENFVNSPDYQALTDEQREDEIATRTRTAQATARERMRVALGGTPKATVQEPEQRRSLETRRESLMPKRRKL